MKEIVRLKIVPVLIVLILVPFIIIYFSMRFATFFAEGYSIVDRFFSILLLLAEIFFVMHTVTYLMNFLRSTQLYPSSVERYFKEFSKKRVAVFIASFNEPAEVLEKTLASASVCARDIGKVYLLDDSTDESKRREAELLALKYGAKYIHRKDRKDFKAGAMNNALKLIDEEYVAVLDSDQRPLPDFLTETVSILESDPKLAFVQVPQIYTNADASRLALGAQCVQLVFFEYICEGKSVTNAMFSCGSNTVFRTSALKEVGGFDEKSVTEDMATSIKIHERGWFSKYYNKPLVAGEGPTTLGSYFTQQGRWSFGSMGLCFRVIRDFIRNPRFMKPMQWWDYFVTTTWYFVGYANMIMVSMPVLSILFGIRPVIAELMGYLAPLLPYVVFNMLSFTLTVLYRGYSPKAALYNIALTFVTSPVYVASAISVLLRRKKQFSVTPKGFGRKLPMKSLFPQLFILAVSIAAIAVACYKYYVTSDVLYIVNIGWLLYFVFLLSFVFYFNTGSKKSEFYEPIFREWKEY